MEVINAGSRKRQNLHPENCRDAAPGGRRNKNSYRHLKKERGRVEARRYARFGEKCGLEKRRYGMAGTTCRDLTNAKVAT